jgi:hypothetical protein
MIHCQKKKTSTLRITNMIESVKYSLSKLTTLAKEDEPIATILNDFLGTLIANMVCIDFDPSKKQEIRKLIGRYGNSFMERLVEFIRIYSVKSLLFSQGYLSTISKDLIEDSDVEFIRENNLLAESNEEINILLEEAFLTARQEEEEGKENNVCQNLHQSIICHLANYYSKVMDEIELLPQLKSIINGIIMHWITDVGSIDVN